MKAKNRNKKYTVAIIGCGKIAVEVENYSRPTQPATHAGAFHANYRTEIVGFCDINEQQLARAAKFFPGVPTYASAELMLKELKPDIVSIATQAPQHYDMVKLAVKYKAKGIVCEKPIADTLKKAKEMVDIVKKSRVKLIVNHMRRYDSLIQKWQKKIKEGLIGDVLQVSCYYYNGLLNNGTHIIDLLRFFLGEVEWVRGNLNERTSWIENDKNIDSVLRFKNGAMATLQTLPKNYGFLNFYFYGTKGRFAIKETGYKFEYKKLIESENYKGYFGLDSELFEEGGLRSLMAPMAQHIVNCLDGKEQPKDTVEDGYKALQIIFALRESAKQNGKVISIQ
ncbi:MAG: Gfo/Idh/MocA family oxidoreductase [Patescibacteria group bacterium]